MLQLSTYKSDVNTFMADWMKYFLKVIAQQLDSSVNQKLCFPLQRETNDAMTIWTRTLRKYSSQMVARAIWVTSPLEGPSLLRGGKPGKEGEIERFIVKNKNSDQRK